MNTVKSNPPEIYNDLLSIYFNDIRKHSNFSYDEEKELSIRIKKGDKKAEEKLILGNLRFVINVVKMYQNKGIPLVDLINIGNMGLIRAAKRFDHKKNFKFISYAVWWIRQQVLQALADQSRFARIPLNKVPLFIQYKKTHDKLQQQLRREPESQEVMLEMGINNDSEYEWLTTLYAPSFSLEKPLGEGIESYKDKLVDYGGPNPGDFINNDTNKKLANEMLEILSEREKEVCKLYYGFVDGYTHTLEEIGSKLNLTRERVRQIKSKAMRQLYNYAKLRNFRQDLAEA